MEDIPRALTARNIKMWQNYCAFRAGADVQAMPKTNDDSKCKEMEKAMRNMLICCSTVIFKCYYQLGSIKGEIFT